MAAIDLDLVKARLRTIGNADDEMLLAALEAAEDEALRYLNRDYLPTLPQDFPNSDNFSEDVPSDADPVAPSVIEAVLLLVKASYEATTPDEINGYRHAAEIKLHPYRVRLGV